MVLTQKEAQSVGTKKTKQTKKKCRNSRLGTWPHIKTTVLSLPLAILSFVLTKVRSVYAWCVCVEL